MSERIARHEAGAKRIVAEGQEFLSRYVAHCKTLAPEKFVHEPRSRTTWLTREQYTDIVCTVVPDSPIAKIVQATSVVSVTKVEEPKTGAPPIKPAKSDRLVGRLRPGVPRFIRPAIMASIASLVTVGLGTALHLYGETQAAPERIVRSQYFPNWPTCHRLTVAVDGCVYVAEGWLNWEYVSEAVGQDLSILRANNSHLVTASIPPQAPIVVWRRHGVLERNQ